MKNSLLTSIAAALVATSVPILAASPIEQEFKQLQQQRDKAIADATDPINRRYQVALEQLLRKATQANDLDAALKIRQFLQGQAQPAEKSNGREFIGRWTIAMPDNGWHAEVEIKKDGTYHQTSPAGGFDEVWEATGDTLKLTNKTKGINTFSLPMKNRTLSGTDNTGRVVTLTKASR
jgi:hypothetical protein